MSQITPYCSHLSIRGLTPFDKGEPNEFYVQTARSSKMNESFIDNFYYCFHYQPNNSRSGCPHSPKVTNLAHEHWGMRIFSRVGPLSVPVLTGPCLVPSEILLTFGFERRICRSAIWDCSVE